MSRVKTLGQFIIEKQSDFPYAKGELSRLLRDIAIASKIVNREVSKAGLADILGDAGEINVQGENVKKLDVFANEQFIVESNVNSFNEAMEMLNELQYFSSEAIKICSEAIKICSDGAIK